MSQFWKKVILILRNIAIILFVVHTILTIFSLGMSGIEDAVRYDSFWLIITMAILYAPYLIFRDKIKKQ